MEAAARLAAEGGVEQVSLQPVARAAGITHSGVLHHFGSREGLLEALFKQASEQLRADLLREIDELSSTGASSGAPQPERMIKGFVRLFERVADPARAPLLASLIASGRDPFRGDEAFGLTEITARIHALRVAIAPGAAGTEEETRLMVEIGAVAMFGELFVGASTRRRLGIPDTPAQRHRLARRIGELLLGHSIAVR